MGKADADSAKATGGAAPKKAAVDSAKAAPTPPPKKATKAGRDGIAAFRALYCATSPPKKAPAPPKMKGVPGRADADAEVVAKVATPMKAAGGTKRKALAPADHEKAINIPLYLYDIPIYLDTYIPIYLYMLYIPMIQKDAKAAKIAAERGIYLELFSTEAAVKAAGAAERGGILNPIGAAGAAEPAISKTKGAAVKAAVRPYSAAPPSLEDDLDTQPFLPQQEEREEWENINEEDHQQEEELEDDQECLEAEEELEELGEELEELEEHQQEEEPEEQEEELTDELDGDPLENGEWPAELEQQKEHHPDAQQEPPVSDADTLPTLPHETLREDSLPAEAPKPSQQCPATAGQPASSQPSKLVPSWAAETPPWAGVQCISPHPATKPSSNRPAGPPPVVEKAGPAFSQCGVARLNREAQAVETRERRRMWAKYLRTRQGNMSGGREKTTKRRCPEKMPRELADRVNAEPQKYFDRWLKHGQSWGKVCIYIYIYIYIIRLCSILKISVKLYFKSI